MASIVKRKNKNGSISWKVQIRIKGVEPINASLKTKKDAKKYAKWWESRIYTKLKRIGNALH
jgi:hypothetical protein